MTTLQAKLTSEDRAQARDREQLEDPSTAKLVDSDSDSDTAAAHESHPPRG